MADTDEMMRQTINAWINDARAMVGMIDCVNGVRDNLGDVKTLVFAAMIAYYGIERIDDIFVAFLKTNFIECGDPLSKVIQNVYGLPSDLALEASRYYPGTFYAVDGFKNIKTGKYRIRRSLYVSSEVDMLTLVKSITHQVNYVINSVRNPLLKKHGGYGSRMGISFEYFDTRCSEVVGLEAAINSLQVKDILAEVERFGFYQIEDSAVQTICNMFFESSKDNPETVEYDMMTEVVQPLYQDPWFHLILEKGRLEGDLVGIRDDFDGRVGTGSYSKFLTACDGLARRNLSPGEVQEHESTAKQLVKTYLERAQ